MRRSISIVIPAYNEEKRLPATLKSVNAYLAQSRWEFSEIIVVDDGSQDATVAVAHAEGVRVVENLGNRGKGYSVRHGMLKAAGDWILFSDADLSAPIEDLEKLWTAAQRENAPVAIGSRSLDRSLIGTHQPFLREIGGRFFNLVMRLVTGLPFGDTQCGFKLFERGAAHEIYRRQKLDGFGFDVEVLYIAQELGYRVADVPVRWNDVPGTKVSLLKAIQSFEDPVKVRWNGIRGHYK